MAWAETNLPEGLASFGLPEAHRVRMRTTHGLERLNKEIKRRTRVVCLFPIPENRLRLVSALHCEQDEQWQSAKIHLFRSVAFSILLSPREFQQQFDERLRIQKQQKKYLTESERSEPPPLT